MWEQSTQNSQTVSQSATDWPLENSLALVTNVNYITILQPNNSIPTCLVEAYQSIHYKIYMRVFIAALFKIVPNWQQLKYPSKLE